MKIFLTILFVAMTCITSVQQDQTELIKGVWHYREINPSGGNTLTITEQLEDGTIRKVDTEKEYPQSDVNHFFLTFNDSELTQNKFGFKLTSLYHIKDQLIYLDGEPFFKIIKLTEKQLIVSRMDSPHRTTYTKLPPDSPFIKLSE